MDITLILVTLLSLTLAAVMTTLAWRLAREERRRSDARVAALAAEIHSDSASAVGGPRTDAPRATAAAVGDLPLHDRSVAPETPEITTGELFAVAPSSQVGSRLAAIAMLGVIVVAAVVAFAVVMSGGRATRSARANTHAVSKPAGDAAPLELVALTHDREADRLTVRGIVRNPSAGGERPHLTAVVFLFDRDGGFVASGRADVDASALGPGTEAPFTVTIPNAGDVGKYRVSFRTDDRIVPHVDRRDRPLAQAR